MSYASEQGILNTQWNAAVAAEQAAIASAAPHVLMRPRIFPDGNMWCALLGENLHEGIAGFGETPAEACAEFDHAWRNVRTPQAMLAINRGTR